MDNIDLLGKAVSDLAEDMKERGFSAILWDNATADFGQIPEVNLASDDAEMPDTSRVMGLYSYNGKLYIVEEDKVHVDFSDFYDKETEVRPSVVTLTESVALKDLGDPENKEGFITEASLEEWLVIADCYFEALNLDNEETIE